MNSFSVFSLRKWIFVLMIQKSPWFSHNKKMFPHENVRFLFSFLLKSLWNTTAHEPKSAAQPFNKRYKEYLRQMECKNLAHKTQEYPSDCCRHALGSWAATTGKGLSPRIVRTTHPAAAGVLGGLGFPATRPRVFQPGVLRARKGWPIQRTGWLRARCITLITMPFPETDCGFLII